MSPAKGIHEILKNAPGFPGTGWTLGYGKMPADPDQYIAILDSGGQGGEVLVAIDYPRVQILVRGAKNKGYDAAYDKINQARELLIAIPESAHYPELDSCIGVGQILPLGEDDSKRPVFSQNLQLIVSYDTSGYREL